MARTKKKRKLKVRNMVAVAAHSMTGAGNHGDEKKEQSRKACREKILPE